MPISRENLLAHEWIGLQVTIDDCPDPSLRDISGRVLDETKNTLTIQTLKRRIVVPKSDTKLKATLPTGESVSIDGDLLRIRPEDRIKKRLNKW